MTNTPRNPPAYPTGDHKGMDLRDAFALAVLPVLVQQLGDGGNLGSVNKDVADTAYWYADAMLSQREK